MRPYTCTAWSCIISFLYIKPQLKSSPVKYFTLYYIVSLYQTTTCSSSSRRLLRCIISFLYIKPQPMSALPFSSSVVLYRFSTSNHNCRGLPHALPLLYYIVSLHQTTTSTIQLIEVACCIISFLYIKPQLDPIPSFCFKSCIISFLYIKPQLFTNLSKHGSSCIISFLYIKPQQWKSHLEF